MFFPVGSKCVLRFLRPPCAEGHCWLHRGRKVVQLDEMCKTGTYPETHDSWSCGSWALEAPSLCPLLWGNNSIHSCSNGLHWRWFWLRRHLTMSGDVFMSHSGDYRECHQLRWGLEMCLRIPQRKAHLTKTLCPRCLLRGPEGDLTWNTTGLLQSAVAVRKPSQRPQAFKRVNPQELSYDFAEVKPCAQSLLLACSAADGLAEDGLFMLHCVPTWAGCYSEL